MNWALSKIQNFGFSTKTTIIFTMLLIGFVPFSLVFSFDKVILLNNFWVVFWLVRIANMYGI